jgi:hypothetical protein
MKTCALCVAAAALAACDQPEPAPAADTLGAAEPSPAPTSRLAPGTYSVTLADGTKVTTALVSDHTYTSTVHGRRAEAGAWRIVGGRACFTPADGQGALARCYSDSPTGSDGSFISTPDRGQPIMVRRIA